ncbi:preprotein translocase subunit SecE [Halorhodospira halochloris]|uniref:Protein translocase subunit SecE n=1 Tax=Halorhodospira halochloris TaxID=1052 RepID=A0A120N071_HALHR|nr:preprotein translocase subunit SecE [Halorhodospira halochloris]MBK1652919.1 preprotein translocase subunit SecE [Halorhodospira halochloris]MCG5530839.1 preprotein translocase subunit SecE [Halorhodospira halochloris]MCG5549369.1 preprotein translocase subunit SecE [Halorhodospira halochloris]BAU58947.1 preprotein translocase subunit SecE [Halorhodospira halochloris]
MKSSAEKSTSPFDVIKWIIAISLAVAGVAGFYFFGDEPLLHRVGGLLAAVAVAFAMLSTTAQGRSLWSFAQGSKQEVRKVIWPTRQETLQTTLLVVAVVIIVAIFLWLMDILLLWLVGMITGHGG